jgi:hypothetical protein
MSSDGRVSSATPPTSSSTRNWSTIASSHSLNSSARKTSSPAPTAAWAAASIRKSPGPSSPPCATPRRWRARSCGVESEKAAGRLLSLKSLTQIFPCRCESYRVPMPSPRLCSQSPRAEEADEPFGASASPVKQSSWYPLHCLFPRNLVFFSCTIQPGRLALNRSMAGRRIRSRAELC